MTEQRPAIRRWQQGLLQCGPGPAPSMAGRTISGGSLPPWSEILRSAGIGEPPGRAETIAATPQTPSMTSTIAAPPRPPVAPPSPQPPRSL